jgi:hypothetical protein
MMIELYRPVRLLNDDHLDEGVGAGAIGTAIEAYDDGYEVEFSRSDGTTIAWFAVRPDEIAPVDRAKLEPGRRQADDPMASAATDPAAAVG